MHKTIKLPLFVIISTTLISLMFLFIDKPVAFFVFDHHLRTLTFFKYFTFIPEIFVALTVLFYVYFIFKLFYQSIHQTDKNILLIANSIAIAFFIKSQLKEVFGRYWPVTWTNNNPSLINDNAYGFHFFHAGKAFASFPSGHTAITFAAMTSIALLYPRCRWLSFIVCGLVVTGLIGMNYHFVSDITAGAIIGFFTSLAIHRIDRSH